MDTSVRREKRNYGSPLRMGAPFKLTRPEKARELAEMSLIIGQVAAVVLLLSEVLPLGLEPLTIRSLQIAFLISVVGGVAARIGIHLIWNSHVAVVVRARLLRDRAAGAYLLHRQGFSRSEIAAVLDGHDEID